MIVVDVSATFFLALVAVIFVGARLRRVVPAEHLTTDSKDAVKLALGLVATMTAILLGLLVSSAKSSFDTTRSEVMEMAAKLALLNRVLLTGAGGFVSIEAVADGTGGVACSYLS